MKKRRSKKYLKALEKKAVKYYFENSDIKIKDIALKYNISHLRMSKAISLELEKRFEKSITRRYINA